MSKRAVCYIVDLFINQRTTEANRQGDSQDSFLDRVVAYEMRHEGLLYTVLPAVVQGKGRGNGEAG